MNKIEKEDWSVKISLPFSFLFIQLFFMKISFYQKIICTALVLGMGMQILFAQTCVGPLSVQMTGSHSADSLNVDFLSEDISCASDANGSLIVMVNGGNPDYAFNWSDAVTGDSIRYNLEQGLYEVTVTDEAGCTKSHAWNIKEMNPSNSELTMNNACGVCWLTNGATSYFYDPNMEYIAGVTDHANDATDLEDTEVCVNIDNTVQTCNNNPYLPRSWKVDPQNQENACLKLFFTQQEFDDFAASLPNETVTAQQLVTDQRLCITAFSGGNEHCSDFQSQIVYSMADAPPLVVKHENPTKGIWSVNVCTDKFATFYLNACNRSLPVELLHFTGKQEGRNNQLDWATASERNTLFFDLEQSTNGTEFTSLTKVDAVGNSDVLHEYSFMDTDPSNRIDYYRLKIVDQDESFEYSNIVVIERDVSSISTLHPTLVNQYAYYKTTLKSAQQLEFWVYDPIGQLAHQQYFDLDAGNHELKLNLERLPVSTYFIQVHSSQGVLETYKIIRR